MRKLKIKLEFEEPPINLVAIENEKEKEFLENYNCKIMDIAPDTEKELYSYYSNYAIGLLNYYNEVMGEPAFELANEVRAMLGHLVDYRLKNDPLKENLEKAYGHFRRLNIDTFKILCDEYDKYFSSIITKFYKYDFRDIASDFLKKYLELYFIARNKYLDAQNNESLGKNSNNVYEYYFEALKSYIDLKNFYLRDKAVIEKRRRNSIIFKILSIVASLTCSVIGASSFW